MGFLNPKGWEGLGLQRVRCETLKVWGGVEPKMIGGVGIQWMWSSGTKMLGGEIERFGVKKPKIGGGGTQKCRL